MSQADQIFKKMCETILAEGESTHHQTVRARWSDGTPAHTIKKFGMVNCYDLSKEFPIMTLRPTSFKNSIKEILWIWQKKSACVKDLGLKIWDSWVDSEGTIGKAYGYQLGVKHRYNEGEFDQVDRVLFDLKHQPYSRRIMTNIYVHEDLHAMQLYPCAYSMTFNVEKGRLNAILNQRSSDILTANNWNVVQYAILVHMFAQVSNLQVGTLMHVISDAHIYERHIPQIKILLNREEYQAPTLWINPEIKNFYDFTVDDFKLENYLKGESMSIEVAI